MTNSLPDKLQFLMPVEPGDSRRFVRLSVVLPVFHHIVDAAEDFAADSAVGGRIRLPVFAGGRTDDRLSKNVDQFLAKLIGGHPDSD